jgi:hypothetical protein
MNSLPVSPAEPVAIGFSSNSMLAESVGAVRAPPRIIESTLALTKQSRVTGAGLAAVFAMSAPVGTAATVCANEESLMALAAGTRVIAVNEMLNEITGTGTLVSCPLDVTIVTSSVGGGCVELRVMVPSEAPVHSVIKLCSVYVAGFRVPIISGCSEVRVG